MVEWWSAGVGIDEQKSCVSVTVRDSARRRKARTEATVPRSTFYAPNQMDDADLDLTIRNKPH